MYDVNKWCCNMDASFIWCNVGFDTLCWSCTLLFEMSELLFRSILMDYNFTILFSYFFIGSCPCYVIRPIICFGCRKHCWYGVFVACIIVAYNGLRELLNWPHNMFKRPQRHVALSRDLSIFYFASHTWRRARYHFVLALINLTNLDDKS